MHLQNGPYRQRVAKLLLLGRPANSLEDWNWHSSDAQKHRRQDSQVLHSSHNINSDMKVLIQKAFSCRIALFHLLSEMAKCKCRGSTNPPLLGGRMNVPIIDTTSLPAGAARAGA